jgi:D-alanine-D-alanine ligase
MPSPHVLLLYNEPVLPAGHPDAESEHDILNTLDIVGTVLAEAGHTVSRLGASRDPAALIAGLRQIRPDVVFNLFEGTADQGNTEAYVAGIMEWLGVPFTGSPSPALWLARSKPLTKHLLAGAGLATPPFLVIEERHCPRNMLGWPLIVKPGREDASVGIDQASVVTNRKQLQDRVDYVAKTYGPPVLVERFIPGREIHATVVELDGTGELTVLPFAEVLFHQGEAKLWPIYSYDAKWKTTSREYELTPVDVPVKLPAELTTAVSRAAKRAYRLIGCRQYARVDFRVTADGEPFILEVNPNPSITSIMLRFGLEEIGWTVARFIDLMTRHAAGHRPPEQVPTVPVLTPALGAAEPKLA